MTEREAPPDWGFEYQQDDPYEQDGWFGREQVGEPTRVDEVTDRPRSQPVAETPSPPIRRLPSPTVKTWTVNGQLRASNDTALTFRAPPQPWYRTKQATIALIAAASVAVAVPVVILVWPGGQATAPSKSTSVAPQTINERATGAQQRAAHSDQRSPATPAPATSSDRGSWLGTGGFTALLDAPRFTAVGEAGRRGYAYACDPGADQCGATAADTNRKQLGHSRGRPQGLALWRLVLT